jgi:hypothetical protein
MKVFINTFIPTFAVWGNTAAYAAWGDTAVLAFNPKTGALTCASCAAQGQQEAFPPAARKNPCILESITSACISDETARKQHCALA